MMNGALVIDNKGVSAWSASEAEYKIVLQKDLQKHFLSPKAKVM